MFSDLVAALAHAGARLARDGAPLEESDQRALATVLALSGAFAAAPAHARPTLQSSWADLEAASAREAAIAASARKPRQ